MGTAAHLCEWAATPADKKVHEPFSKRSLQGNGMVILTMPFPCGSYTRKRAAFLHAWGGAIQNEW